MSSDAFTRLDIPRLSGRRDDDERERARMRGHAAGYAEGMRLARADAEREAARRAAHDADVLAEHRSRAATGRAALDAAVVELEARAHELTAGIVERVHALAVELAEAILGHELSDEVRAAVSVAARVERAADGAPGPVAVLAPLDAETLAELGALPAGIRVETDPALARGDAIVRVTDGAVDLRVTAALARARAALTEAGG
ncbi:MAG: FliH/SctL family protein [Microbacterium arborescens]